MNQSENYQQNEKSFNASTLHEIFYLEGSDAIFQITKGRKTKFFYRSFIQDFRELSMTHVSRFRSTLPHQERSRSIFQNRFFPGSNRSTSSSSCSSMETGTKISRFLFFSRRLSDTPTGENIK